jgi:hypothetical protein
MPLEPVGQPTARSPSSSTVRPQSPVANKTPKNFQPQYIAVAPSAGNGENFNPKLYS